ncbi:MAG: hypothetical protein ACLSG5_10740 [Oscillospiraceae bacterium]
MRRLRLYFGGCKAGARLWRLLDRRRDEAKTVTLSGFALVTGAIVGVKFPTTTPRPRPH